MSITFPLRRGAPASLRNAIASSIPQRDVTRPLGASDVSLMRCVGIVKRPQVQLQNGLPVWQCRLLVPQVGVSAQGGASTNLIMGKEHMLVKCSGSPWYELCTTELYDGATVAVVGTAIQRPRYVAIHSTYRYDTEVHVGHEGFVSLIGSPPR
jgi:hypothetical protein